ncbi:MAG: coenzyme F420-0:L-glutamate ligase [Candidatus Kariarchaeaceae archaeon]
MRSVQIYAFKSPKIISWGDDVFENFIEALRIEDFRLQNGDIVVLTSKVYSMQQESAIKLTDVIPSEQAIILGEEASLDPRVAQLVIDESDGVLGAVYHAILAKTIYGLSANAGIDLSNSPDGYALLLPRNPDQEALRFKEKISSRLMVDVGVLIVDSRTIPLRRGTTAVALGVAGMDPIIDERGKVDLYGNKMVITTKALADNVATAVNMLLGETNEMTPFGIARGIPYEPADQVTMKSTLMPEDQCLYFSPFMKLLHQGERK